MLVPSPRKYWPETPVLAVLVQHSLMMRFIQYAISVQFLVQLSVVSCSSDCG